MPVLDGYRRGTIRRRFKKCGIDCPIYLDSEITSLSDFFAVFSRPLVSDLTMWFRGHADLTYRLAPSALRYETPELRLKALSLVDEMRRFLEMKLPRPPAPDDHLAWMQVAQHYGLPTRLLDWTQNAAAALFFACGTPSDVDGLVAVINPSQLNQAVDASLPRIFSPRRDQKIIDPYLKGDGHAGPTIAINPTWNTERIAMQQGAFTLHGNKNFELNSSHTSSLTCVPILREHKNNLLFELHMVGIGEMFIFPEPEHVCAHLKRLAGLDIAHG